MKRYMKKKPVIFKLRENVCPILVSSSSFSFAGPLPPPPEMGINIPENRQSGK